MGESINPAQRLLGMVLGYPPAQILYTAARLGLADQLANGPLSTAELAAATGTHEPSLHRLLRALACLGVVTQLDDARFELAPGGQPLRVDAPDSIRPQVLLFCAEKGWRSWGELEYSIRTGKVAGEYVTGLPVFEYFAQNPEKLAVFNAAMASITRSVVAALVTTYDFSGCATVVDIGGGDGTLISGILRAAPSAHGVLFDLPTGVESAAATLEAAGVADRCRVVTGSFFDSVPGGADAYVLKSIIHDWDDEQAGTILRNLRKAMPEHARVLVIEPVLPDRVSPADTPTVIMDLNMMVSTGGRERTRDEFDELFTKAGLEITNVLGPLPGGYRIIEGKASSTE